MGEADSTRTVGYALNGSTSHGYALNGSTSHTGPVLLSLSMSGAKLILSHVCIKL